MKKLMMLGAGSCQLNAINKIKQLGFLAVVSDHRVDSPGKKIADVSVLADTFSFETSYDGARQHGVDGIMTSGTDQPVLTVNRVAEAMNLPQLLSIETALGVTNKRHMKARFKAYGIPTVPYAICAKNFENSELAALTPPYVVKPVDSQGQRGIYKLNSIEAVRKHMDEVLNYSREEQILVESYYENDEITVSGWVQNGVVHILTVTDRVTFSSDLHIGVCTAHEYPSKQLAKHRTRIMDLTHEICRVFNINNGPIYFQYLVGAEGLYVNEIACRIGGAYEDVFIPVLTSVDILELNILSAVEPHGERLKKQLLDLEHYHYSELGQRLSVQLFFCEAGQVCHMTPRETLLQAPYLLDMNYNIKIGDQLKSIENASQRAGYAIILGDTEVALHDNIEKFYAEIKVLNSLGKNLIMKQKRIYRP